MNNERPQWSIKTLFGLSLRVPSVNHYVPLGKIVLFEGRPLTLLSTFSTRPGKFGILINNRENGRSRCTSYRLWYFELSYCPCTPLTLFKEPSNDRYQDVSGDGKRVLVGEKYLLTLQAIPYHPI